jgi:hypothetical protein
MKAITLWQPWASLIACGAKKYETRSWATRYRGPIAIHAAKRDPVNLPYHIQVEINPILLEHYSLWKDLPRGAVVATAELVQCWEIKIINDNGHPFATAVDHDGAHFLTITRDGEQLFGDFTPGRYAWELANVQMLAEPIPVKGKQGLWNWERGSN